METGAEERGEERENIRLRRSLSVAVAAVLTLSAHAQSRLKAPPDIEGLRLNNIGVAYMDQQLPDRALERFRAAAKIMPDVAIPKLNEGIALLYMGRQNDAETALQAAAAADPHSARPAYCLGLLRLQSGDTAGARSYFMRAEAADPRDADTHYYLADVEFHAKRFAAAESQYEATLRANPLHASAEFGLARALQRMGKTSQARVHLARFKELADSKYGTTVTSQYTLQGKFALAVEMPLPVPAVGPMITVRYVPREIAGTQSLIQSKSAAGLCLLDLDGSGVKTILAIGNGPQAVRAFRFGNHMLKEVSLQGSGLEVSGQGVSCAVGDFDNDGLPDVAVAFSDHVKLFRNLGHGHFADVTGAAGIRSLNQPAGVTFVDFDHDGDLDLFVTGSPIAGGKISNVLWRNNGNGTFTEWTTQAGLQGKGSTVAAALSDLNNDRAIDLVVTGDRQAPAVYLNQREGAFRKTAVYSASGLPSTRGVAVADFDKDGWMDVVLTHAHAPGLTVWRNTQGRSFHRASMALSGVLGAWGVTPVDFDNDGWVDLAVLFDTANGRRLKLLRNIGNGEFKDVSVAMGVANMRINGARSLIAADLEDRGAPDLVVSRSGKPPLVLENIGAEHNHSLRLRLVGLADNKSAIGTKVEVFADGLWQKFEVGGNGGYQSQGDLELSAGLGSKSKVDIVRILWPTGVPQDELDVSTDKPLALTELDRRGSSCPVLFAWNGKKFQFISDVIGAAVIGHWISPNARNSNDPDEWIKIDGSTLEAQNGKLHLRFGEPMEEINYIDQIRLIAVDHPEATEVFPDERFLSEPPFARGDMIVASPSTHPVSGAWDNTGRDVRAELAEKDHVYVRDFHNLSYAGFAEPHALTLDVGAWSADRPLRLFLHGYIEYFSASSMYAAWQSGLLPEPPSVDVQMPDGSWKRIINDMGFPAGLPRTMVVDLTGKLPPGAHRIRLKTNLQIYWDQLLVDNGAAVDGARQTEIPLSSAQLVFRGYPRQIEGATPGDLTYDYDAISATGPFQWQRGMYTRYGDVKRLLDRRDDQYVIFGSGEEIDADFDALALPPLPLYWKRDYFFYADGYVKDMDFYEALPFTVSKLPFRNMETYPYDDNVHYPDDAAALDYQLEWNNRFESGTKLQRFSFDYRSPAGEHTAAGRAAGGTR